MKRSRRFTPAARSDSPAQTSFLPTLAAAEAERRALVRGALAQLGVRERIAREVEGLVMYLECSSGDTGCAAYVRTLCLKLGLARRTLFRRLALAREHRLLMSQRARPGGPCVNVVDWNRIRALAYSGEPCPQPVASAAELAALACDSSQHAPQHESARLVAGTRPLKSGTTRCQSGTTSCQSGTTYNQFREIQPATPTSPQRLAETSAGEWIEAETAVAAAGVHEWQRAIREARARGLTPADVLAIVAWWRSRVATAGWHSPAGMLAYQLRTADPQQLATPASQPMAAAARTGPPAEAPTAPARCEALERLSPDALADLAERVFADHPVLRSMYARDGLGSPMCYEVLAAAAAIAAGEE